MALKTRRELALDQIEFQLKIQSQAGVNIIECNHCGQTVMHSTENEGSFTNIECFSCRSIINPNDCTDFWYENAEMTTEFDIDRKDFTILVSRLDAGLLSEMANTALEKDTIDNYIQFWLDQEENPNSRNLVKETLGPELYSTLLSFKNPV